MVKQSALPRGVEIRGKRIRIAFSWNGQRYRENYPFPPTPRNIQRAGQLATEIRSKIDFGIFGQEDFRHYFPDSTKVSQDTPLIVFRDYAQRWLDTAEVSVNTRTEYRKILNKYWMPTLATRPLAAIKPAELRELVQGIDWPSAKTRNNALIPLRGIFGTAVDDDLIERNPTEKLKNRKHQKIHPDPFSREEAEAIIADLYERHTDDRAIYAAYFELAFFAGMRASEMLALKWEDIDLRGSYARVSKAQSKGRLNNETKTYRMRDVMLNERARHALSVCATLTKREGGHVFRSSRTGQHFKTEKAPRVIFTEALKELGIRHRPAKNCRHTYATMLLMAGVNPTFVAGQLGHSVTMTLTVYSKWIHSQADWQELGKLDMKGFAPNLPQAADLNS